jgi:copper homeostasis protein
MDRLAGLVEGSQRTGGETTRTMAEHPAGGGRRVLVEVCAGSVADLEAAAAAGVDRAELCGGLEAGGLTPSTGLVETALAAGRLPIVAMLRPRAGGFAYDRHEFDAMLRDARRFVELGVSGVVFGVFDQRGRIDRERSRELVAAAGPAAAVFHRAFDFVAEPAEALETLIDIGCDRVLTSGGRATASDGAAALASLVRQAAGRIEIMPGGGITADNVAAIVRTTGCREVHIGASTAADDGSLGSPAIELYDARFGRGAAYRAVRGDAAAQVVAALGGSSGGTTP